jgi:hypothetical protein
MIYGLERRHVHPKSYGLPHKSYHELKLPTTTPRDVTAVRRNRPAIPSPEIHEQAPSYPKFDSNHGRAWVESMAWRGCHLPAEVAQRPLTMRTDRSARALNSDDEFRPRWNPTASGKTRHGCGEHSRCPGTPIRGQGRSPARSPQQQRPDSLVPYSLSPNGGGGNLGGPWS